MNGNAKGCRYGLKFLVCATRMNVLPASRDVGASKGPPSSYESLFFFERQIDNNTESFTRFPMSIP